MAGAIGRGYIPKSGGSQISGFWEMPKIGGPEKGGIRDHQNSPFSGSPKNGPILEGPKKRPPKKDRKTAFFRTWKKGRFLTPSALVISIF